MRRAVEVGGRGRVEWRASGACTRRRTSRRLRLAGSQRRRERRETLANGAVACVSEAARLRVAENPERADRRRIDGVAWTRGAARNRVRAAAAGGGGTEWQVSRCGERCPVGRGAARGRGTQGHSRAGRIAAEASRGHCLRKLNNQYGRIGRNREHSVLSSFPCSEKNKLTLAEDKEEGKNTRGILDTRGREEYRDSILRRKCVSLLYSPLIVHQNSLFARRSTQRKGERTSRKLGEVAARTTRSDLSTKVNNQRG